MRLRPDRLAEGYGTARGTPLVDAELAVGPVGPPGPTQVWRLAGEVPGPGGPVAYDQRLTRRDDGSMVFAAAGARMGIDPSQRRLLVDAPTESLSRQLVTTYGLPLLLLDAPVLVLHACAAVPPGREAAVVVCGPSGAGKSSLAAGLIGWGWRAVSEDVCAVDLRGGDPVVWPGPPWVRREGAGPAGSTARFTTLDKTAWDIAPWQVDSPVAVAGLVFLQAPGGPGVQRDELSPAEAIPLLARSVTWLGDPQDRASATFGPCVRVAGSTPAVRLRLPKAEDWLVAAESALRLTSDA